MSEFREEFRHRHNPAQTLVLFILLAIILSTCFGGFF
ncbi:putative membrane protein YwzB [Paenibacillus baekrokdamisoli]|nr:putative membrane protein YwzB [Paenibacillus baekrokdamisoli]